MLAADKEFRTENQKFLRQTFFEKRILFLEGVMTYDYCNDPTMPMGWPTSPRGVMDQLFYLDNLEEKPIRLFIDSPGGIADTCLLLYDTINSLRSPVYTIARGIVASAAVPILAAGKRGKRFIFPNSKTMIHLPHGGAHGDPKDMAIALKQFEKVKDTYVRILSELSGTPTGELEVLIERDHWMSADETIEKGFADHKIVSLSDIASEENIK